MRLTKLLVVPAALLIAGAASAQAVPFRGAVQLDDSSGYYLTATGWPVKFRFDIPDYWMNVPLLMEAENVGTDKAPQLAVRKASPTDLVLDIGDVRTGYTTDISVLAGQGNYVQVWMDFPSHLLWMPLKGVGAWVLGSGEAVLGQGVADDLTGIFRLGIPVPDNADLVGLRLTTQAVVYDPDAFQFVLFSNPETRIVVSGNG